MKSESNFAPSAYALALHESPPIPCPFYCAIERAARCCQSITSAETVASPEFQGWLEEQNRAGSDVFVEMKPLRLGVSRAS